MIKNIQTLYGKVEDKFAFCLLVKHQFYSNFLTTTWFTLWDIPEQHQERVVELLQKTIANQTDVIDPQTL